MSWLIVIASIASIPLAAEMARERARSRKVWLWLAALVGPLAPLALLVLGEAKHRVSAVLNREDTKGTVHPRAILLPAPLESTTPPKRSMIAWRRWFGHRGP